MRQLILASTIVVASCGGDEVLVPDHLRGDPTCTWLIDTWGMTDAEFESRSRAEELNDMALDICEQLAERWPFEWNECQQDHDDGEWLDVMFRSAGAWEHPSGTALGCVGE